MKFMKSDDEEVLDMLAKRSPQMRKAVGVLKELSADERTHMLYEKREMALIGFESQLVAKDAVIVEQAAALANKDAALANKDAEIARLRAMLAVK